MLEIRTAYARVEDEQAKSFAVLKFSCLPSDEGECSRTGELALTGSLPALGGWDKLAPTKLQKAIAEEQPGQPVFFRRVVVPVPAAACGLLEFNFKFLRRCDQYNDPLWRAEPDERHARITLPPRPMEGIAMRFEAELPAMSFGQAGGPIEITAKAVPSPAPSPTSSPRAPKSPGAAPHGPASCPSLAGQAGQRPARRSPEPTLKGASAAPVPAPIARLRQRQRCNSFPGLGATLTSILEGEDEHHAPEALALHDAAVRAA